VVAFSAVFARVVLTAGLVASAALQASALASAPVPPRSHGHAIKKDAAPDTAGSVAPDGAPLLATLVQTHTGEHLLLTPSSPQQPRFEALLQDRVTGQAHAFDPRLLGLLRTLASQHPGARIELVSGFRSPKLNEMMRKKGHHVASHSQHSLGHAVDFRIVPAGETKGMDPRALEKEIRALGWDGGVGTYTLASDWFVHADVGKNRRWKG
jgi:uncharacterized protein YcbK (DUF882 family)